MVINIIRTAMYFSVVGIQWIHCTVDGFTCAAMILLVPLILGVIDGFLIWGSGRESVLVKLISIAMSITSITVATITFAPILILTTPLTEYQSFMLYISLAACIISVIELLTVVTDLATPEKKDVVLEGSVRTYERWE